MSKFSDNASEGNNPQSNTNKIISNTNVDKFKTTKGALMAQGSGILGELKIENSKN